MNDFKRLARWLRRSRPTPLPLARAALLGSIATLTNVGLLVGAVGLLVESSRRPGLAAVAGALIIIELFAFLRSPLRFSERISSHRLGFDAVTRWRRWLVLNVLRWDYSKWRTYASGDLLERSLRDTDELQDLWLRCALPSINIAIAMIVSDVVILVLPPHHRWWPFALTLLAIQVMSVTLLASNIGAEIRADRALRRTRAAFQSELVEFSAVTPELFLLDRSQFVDERFDQKRQELNDAERHVRRVRRRSSAVALVSGLLALQLLQVERPVSSSTWDVVVALLCVATSDMLVTLRQAFETAVAVSAASERLEQLESAGPPTGVAWPHDSTLRLEGVSVEEGGTYLVRNASAVFRPGIRAAITGPSGTGKSTLLRAMCRLDHVTNGVIHVGEVNLEEIDESALRSLMAYVPSEPGLTRGYARDVVALGRESTRVLGDDLMLVGLTYNEATPYGELSRGERQRVAAVRSVVTSPRVIIADEPTSGLGLEETRQLLALFDSTGATVIVATHDPNVMEWCDEVYELDEGRLRRLSR